jgi:hypothetical protein
MDRAVPLEPEGLDLERAEHEARRDASAEAGKIEARPGPESRFFLKPNDERLSVL